MRFYTLKCDCCDDPLTMEGSKGEVAIQIFQYRADAEYEADALGPKPKVAEFEVFLVKKTTMAAKKKAVAKKAPAKKVVKKARR